MEFNILKSIETPIAYQYPALSQLLSPFQSKDYVNPGIGGVTQLFDVYVPIFYEKPPYCSIKKLDQEGFGALTKSSNAENSTDVSLAIDDHFNEKKEVAENKINANQNTVDNNRTESIRGTKGPIGLDDKEIESTNERKRKLMGNDVFDAFLHPVFKTTKLALKSAKKEPDDFEATLEKGKVSKKKL